MTRTDSGYENFPSACGRGAMGRVGRGLAVGVVVLLAGCATGGRPQIEAALKIAPAAASFADYRLACPDLVRLHLRGEHPWSGDRPIEPDGRVDLGPLGRPRLAG